MLETLGACSLFLSLLLLIETRIPQPLLEFFRTRRVYDPEDFQTDGDDREQGIERKGRSSEPTGEEGEIVRISKSLLEIIAFLVNLVPEVSLAGGQCIVPQRRYVNRHTVFPHRGFLLIWQALLLACPHTCKNRKFFFVRSLCLLCLGG